MKRTQYGINFQTINSGDFGQVLPVGFVDVAPGDTVQGIVKCRVVSDTA